MSLEIKNLFLNFNGIEVVKNFSLKVNKGQIVALLGPNGAGKSEIVLAVSGLEKVNSGSIKIDGEEIIGKNPEYIRSMGIASVPEGHSVLTKLTVYENIKAAASLKSGFIKNISDILDLFPELSERQNQYAGSLSGGQQQMLTIAQALVSQPKYLLIDEMSLGLAPLIVNRLMKVVTELKKNNVGIILIEQFTSIALKVSENAIILRNGTIQYDGPSKFLLKDKNFLNNVYFGK